MCGVGYNLAYGIEDLPNFEILDNTRNTNDNAFEELWWRPSSAPIDLSS